MSVTTAVFAYHYNPQGLVATRAFSFRVLYIPTSTTLTHYSYDPKGRMLAKLEEKGDGIYYIITSGMGRDSSLRNESSPTR
jgi:hypothetical protein